MREAHWYHAGGTRARLRGARGVRGPEMPPLGPPRGSRAWPPGAAPGARRQAPRKALATPRRRKQSPRRRVPWPEGAIGWPKSLPLAGESAPAHAACPRSMRVGAQVPARGQITQRSVGAGGGLARLAPRCDRAASGAKPTGALLIAPARGNAARGVRMSNTPFGSGGGRWGGVLAHMFAICSHRGAHAWRSDTLAPRAALRRDQGECGTWGGRLRPAARRARG